MILPLLLGSTLLASSVNISVTEHIKASSQRTLSQTTRQEIRSEVKDTIVENRCERVTDRVKNHARAGENVKDRRARIHQGVVKRLQALFTKLKDKGCDTSAAESNLATWEDMIGDYRDHFNTWLDALHDLQNKVCQENAQDYRSALQIVHDKRKVAQDKKREISQFYQNTLKHSVKDLRSTCQ